MELLFVQYKEGSGGMEPYYELQCSKTGCRNFKSGLAAVKHWITLTTGSERRDQKTNTVHCACDQHWMGFIESRMSVRSL